jgi:hypothetical protein
MDGYGALKEWYWQAKTKVLGEKSVPVPLCPPQIPHEVAWDWTQASEVRDLQATAWAMAMPLADCWSYKQTALEDKLVHVGQNTECHLIHDDLSTITHSQQNAKTWLPALCNPKEKTLKTLMYIGNIYGKLVYFIQITRQCFQKVFVFYWNINCHASYAAWGYMIFTLLVLGTKHAFYIKKKSWPLQHPQSSKIWRLYCILLIQVHSLNIIQLINSPHSFLRPCSEY